jgi:DNA repair exonuclease SbcCD ATPase subunit
MKYQKYLIFSDIHLSNYSGKVNPIEKISQRLVDQKSILQQLIDLAVEQDAVLLDGGDVFHCVGAVPTEALNVYSWFLKEVEKYELKYYATQGNHDLVLRKDGKQWHSILNLFQDKQQRDKELSEMKVRFVDYDEEDVYSIKDNDIVVLHKQPACSNKYGFKHEGVDWKKVAKNNRLCFYGHFHETKKLSSHSFVIGQPMQMTQADVDEERGCWLVNSEDWSVEFIKLDYPELQKIEKLEAKEEKIEERIKATSFNDILLEWLAHENKENTYLELIKNDLQDKIQMNKNVFKGRIEKVYVKDFVSFEEITFQFKNGFCLVLGENGSGKTTLFESILWILYDITTKNLAKNEVIRNRPTKQKDAYGELSLVDDKTYTIQRSVKNGLEVICDKKNLVEGMTKIQAQEFLEKNVLGFDKNTYLASCYFSQEGLLTLAQLGDSETTNLVTNLLGFETYNSLHELMSTRIKEVTLQLDLEEQRSVRLNNDIWKNSEQQKNLKEQIEMFTKQQCSLKDEQLKVNQQLDEFNGLLVKTVVPTVTTEEIDDSLLVLNSSKTEMSTKLRKLQEDGNLRTQDLRKQLSILQKDLGTIIQEQNKIDKEKTKSEIEKRLVQENISKHEAIVASLKENKCSYCGTILNKEDLEKHLAEEQAEIYVLVNKSIPRDNLELDKLLEKFYDQEAQIQELMENINKQILESDAEIKSLITLNFAEITKIECDIQELQIKKGQAIKEITEANSRKDSLTQQIKQLEQRKLALVNQIAQVNVDNKVEQLTDLKITFDCLDAQKLDINNNKVRLVKHLDIYTFWQNAFSNKGIRPLLLDRFVNEVNNIIHHYCYEVSNGEFLVEFNPTSKTRAGIERNKLDLQVIYQDKTVPYASLSGGEKTRANLPLCLGLNKWISKKYGIKNGLFGIVILDELFANLDVKGRENVAALLTEEGRNRSVFVIDHNPTLESYTDHILQVSKENEVTNLQVI